MISVRVLPAFFALCLLSAIATGNETTGVEPECAADEIDAGEYCISVIEVPPTGAGAPGATPFRSKSIIPGVIDRSREPARTPPVAAPAEPPGPVVAQHGYGIQVGAFSLRTRAAEIGRELEAAGHAFMLSPIALDERVIWACITGPYADYHSALPELEKLRSDERFGEAWIKPLQGLKLEGVNDG